MGRKLAKAITSNMSLTELEEVIEVLENNPSKLVRELKYIRNESLPFKDNRHVFRQIALFSLRETKSETNRFDTYRLLSSEIERVVDTKEIGEKFSSISFAHYLHVFEEMCRINEKHFYCPFPFISHLLRIVVVQNINYAAEEEIYELEKRLSQDTFTYLTAVDRNEILVNLKRVES